MAGRDDARLNHAVSDLIPWFFAMDVNSLGRMGETKYVHKYEKKSMVKWSTLGVLSKNEVNSKYNLSTAVQEFDTLHALRAHPVTGSRCRFDMAQ